MSEKHDPVFNPLSWFLILLLIGLYALYTWYQGNLKESLADKEIELGETAQLLTASNAKLGMSEQKIQDLNAEIGALTAQYRQQEQGLQGELDTANQGIQGLKGEMAALRVQHAESLEAERQEASRAYTELQGRYDAAKQEVAGLGTEIERLNQAMADAIAKSKVEAEQAATVHQAEMEQREQQLNERIGFFRTALEGSEPERAAQMVGIDEQIQSNLETIEQLETAVQGLETTKTDLSAQLASTQQVVEEREQVLARAAHEHQATLRELSERQSELTALRTKYDETVTQASQDYAAAEERLLTEQAAHAETKSAAAVMLTKMKEDAANDLQQAQADAASALEAANSEATAAMERTMSDAAETLQASQDEAAAAMAEADGKIASLTENLGNERAALQSLQQQHDSIVAEMNEKLAGIEQTLAGVEAELGTATEQAAESKAAYEQRISALEEDIAEGKTRIADLGQTLEQARNDALQLRAANEKALTDQRTLYLRFTELGGRQTEQGMLLSLANTELQFRANRADLPEELPSVDKIAALLVEYPGLNARVEGHTDSAGRDETNLTLSQQRADAVKQALIDRGVAAERLISESIGEARPIADNNTGAGRRQNRRVEIYVTEQ